MKLAITLSVSSLLLTAPTFAKPVGTPVGSMRHDRQDPAVVVLADGKVAAIGGFATESFSTPRAIEIFDPARRTWTTAREAPLWGRWGHTATLLADGRVLVVGGSELDTQGGFGSWPRAAQEIWDPRTDQWSGTALLAEPRSAHTATLLDDGRVVIAGGRRDDNAGATEAEVFDPTTGRFKNAGSLVRPRILHAAVALPGGRLAVIGGHDMTPGDPDDDSTDSIEVWDPATRTWREKGKLRRARAAHTATLLGDGRVLVVGGEDANGFIGEAELCDLVASTCAAAGSLATPRSAHAATLLRDGRVLVTGGDTGTGSRPITTASVEVWDPKLGFRKHGTLASTRADHGAVVLSDGAVLLVGGARHDPSRENNERADETAEIIRPLK